jgi:predicted dithiol-disulfide oxidoreductase (DUF899 family)
MNTGMSESSIANHPVVSEELWVAERRKLLAREKELTRLRDQVARERRALPWVQVEKVYSFEAPEGTRTLVELFEGRRQLMVQHFMFGPGWQEGCRSCSFMADHAVYYNYDLQPFECDELPGISVFYREDAGGVFHTYSTYRRGVEAMMGTYNLLDLTPKGRDEHDGPMEWVRHHDRYER